MAKGITKIHKRAKTKHRGQLYPWIQCIFNTYGGPHKPVTIMYSFLLRNGNLLYIIFLMYMNRTVILKHCSLNVCIKDCLLRKNGVGND